MKEIERILALWALSEQVGEPAVLATVVKTRGSSYRLPGAHLLLARDGRRAGSVSGGCLEDDLVKKAWWFTQNGPVIRRYDTTPDGEIAAEFGLGCNGIIHVLLERVSPRRAAILDLFRTVRAERRPAAIAHVIEPAVSAGQRLIIDTRGVITHNLSDPELVNSCCAESRAALRDGAPRSFESNNFGAFVEMLVPAVRLLIFGAGDDAVPLTSFAKSLGWQVLVFDGRSHYARPERFPDADQVRARQPVDAGMTSEIDRWTVAVLMSHSYRQDLENLRELAPLGLRYLGILGPRKRTAQLLEDAGLESARIESALHGPMGLDLGADGPEQVALAVVAEIQATLNGREGGQLRERRGSIHSREDDSADPEKFWPQSIICA